MRRMDSDVCVIGGGAAGMMTAVTAARRGFDVTLLERNQYVGRKLGITGKGRCNVTNNCDIQQIMASIPRNSRFLYSAMSDFGPDRVMEFFEGLAVPLKTERGGRVFPVSDRSADIVNALRKACRDAGVHRVEDRARHVLCESGRVTGVEGEKAGYSCRALAICTGGLSYPLTGSTGDGYDMARELGHKVTELEASLVPLVEKGDYCRRMQGLSLKNTGLKVVNGRGKTVYSDFGELLFTHFGLSGPLVLSASAHLNNFEKENYRFILDLKPALDEKKLDARILRDFEERANKTFANALDGLFHKKMIPVIIERSGIDPDTRVNSITKQQRRALLELTKAFTVEISGKRPVEDGIITRGGVSVKEVDPSTMASKLIQGLYFAGEILDVDAYTGGYNLQIAWATGHLAGSRLEI